MTMMHFSDVQDARDWAWQHKGSSIERLQDSHPLREFGYHYCVDYDPAAKPEGDGPIPASFWPTRSIPVAKNPAGL